MINLYDKPLCQIRIRLRQFPADGFIFVSGEIHHRGGNTGTAVSGQRWTGNRQYGTPDMRFLSSPEQEVNILSQPGNLKPGGGIGERKNDVCAFFLPVRKNFFYIK